MKKIKISNRLIGEGEPCFIIAEVGTNHNGKLEYAKDLVRIAKEAGADAVKFQSFKVENWISSEMKSFPTISSKENLFDFLKKYELPYNMYKEIKFFAEKLNIICFSTPSHKTDIDILYKMGIPVFKFGSVQITDLPTIKYASNKGKPIILSTGASNLSEVSEAIEICRSVKNDDIILLHCTSLYPTKMEQVNLNVIKTFKVTFPDVIIGYSDHTLNPTIIPVAAVTMGAKVIEKHITLDKKMSGPDHKFALEPKEFKSMVKAIRKVEKSFGSPIKKSLSEERETMRLGRRSLIAKEDISKGTKIKYEHITIKRPGYGIPPKFLDLVVGRVSKMNIKKDSVIKWDMI